MEMEDRLASVTPCVGEQAETCPVQSPASRDLVGHHGYAPDQLCVLFFQEERGSDVAFGNYQYVRGRLWVYILEGV